MAATNAPRHGDNRWSWRRTSAIAFSVALHVFAFVLMVAPIAAPQAEAALDRNITTIEIIKPPPPKPPEPPPPLQPPKPPQTIVEQRALSPELPPLPQSPVVVKLRSPVAIAVPLPQPLARARQQITIAPSADIAYKARNHPRYPLQAIRMRHEGTVILLVLVGLDGNPKEIKIAQSSGFGELDRAAIKAAQGWRFYPGSSGGVPYEGWARVPVEFTLNQF